MSTPIPSTEFKLGNAKAIIAAIAGALVGGGTSLQAAISDGVVTPSEWIGVAIAAVVGSGVTGLATYLKSTTVTPR